MSSSLFKSKQCKGGSSKLQTRRDLKRGMCCRTPWLVTFTFTAAAQPACHLWVDTRCFTHLHLVSWATVCRGEINDSSDQMSA